MPLTKPELEDVLEILTRPSGSVGPWTATRNAHGPFVRARVVPTNPDTAEQRTHRRLFRNCTRLWLNWLTATERESWAAYAKGLPIASRGGGTRHLTGFQHFVRSNNCRVNWALGLVRTAPTLQNVGRYTWMPSFIEALPARWRLYWDDTDDFAGESGTHILCYRTAFYPATVKSFRPPVIHRYTVSATIAPPADLPVDPFPPLNSHVWVRYQITRADGRLSYPQQHRLTVRAAT